MLTDAILDHNSNSGPLLPSSLSDRCSFVISGRTRLYSSKLCSCQPSSLACLCSLPSVLSDRYKLTISARSQPGSSKSSSLLCFYSPNTTLYYISLQRQLRTRPGIDPSQPNKLCRRAPSPLSMRLLLPKLLVPIAEPASGIIVGVRRQI